ncbi:hypothetical protein J0H58_08630 [bacterium]|nr:hypothetical protein [bacterium]
MIRFSCPHCHRKFALPDALARVPLLCKGCGQRLVPAEVGIESGEEPVPENGEPTRQVPEPEPPPVAVAPTPSDLLSDEVRVDLELSQDPAAPEPPAPTKPPAGAPPPAVAPPRDRRALGVVVDVAVGLALAGGGALLGEFAVGKSTATIIQEAGSAPRFPPTDLLLWIGCVATPLLVYALLANRGKTVGGWLRRRG